MNEGKKPTIKITVNGIETDLSPVLVFNDGENKLHKTDLTGRTSEKNPVATPAGQHNVLINSKAYDILEKKCGQNKAKLNEYLKTILDFELKHSDDPKRHKKRSLIEEEILSILKDSGYFI